VNNLLKLGAVAILVVSIVIIWLVASRPTRAVDSPDAPLPSVFTPGATIQLDFGSPPWRIVEVQGQWLRVRDASAEPQYSTEFWIHATTGRIWSVKPAGLP
jgi:hypothetical protein